MNTKKYILSQRLSYLILGSVVGFFIGLNKEPVNYYILIGFVLLIILVSWWIKNNG